jgi:hypothetical protein
MRPNQSGEEVAPGNAGAEREKGETCTSFCKGKKKTRMRRKEVKSERKKKKGKENAS